jgi:IclR family acetate operon transcriptional repressor
MTLQSVDHALSVLEILRDHEEVGVSELAKLLDVSPSSAHRLLTTMMSRGFVQQTSESRRYTAGHALRTPAEAADRAREKVTHRLLERLASLTGETVHLAMLYGSSIRYIDCATPQRPECAPSLMGTTVPAHASSSGKALLARHTTRALLRILPTERLEAFAPATITTRTMLNRDLMTVRLNGYAKDVGEWKAGTTAVSISVAPISGHPLALSVAASNDRLRLVRDETRSSERELFKELCAASRALTSQLAG